MAARRPVCTILAGPNGSGRSGIIGNGKDETAYRLSFLYFEDQILWSQTAVRKQGLDFPDYDLLSEIDICELGIRLKKFRVGEIASISKAEFRTIFESFCERYGAHPSHSMGSFPFEGTWDLTHGWRARG